MQYIDKIKEFDKLLLYCLNGHMNWYPVLLCIDTTLINPNIIQIVIPANNNHCNIIILIILIFHTYILIVNTYFLKKIRTMILPSNVSVSSILIIVKLP